MFRSFTGLICGAVLWAAPGAFAADVKVVEEIAAKVNGDIVTKGDLEDQRKELERTLHDEQHLSGAALSAAVRDQQKDILANLISQRLLVQRAKDLQINVDTDVNKELIRMQVEFKIPDNEKFREYIREQTGMSYEDYKQKMVDRELTRRVIGAEVSSHINIPEPDLRKFYDEHKQEYVRKAEVYLSQILISTEGKNAEQTANAEKKAKDLVAKARGGDRFDKLAQENSDDPGTAADGGQLGALQPDQLRPELQKVVTDLKKGQVTDPIRLPQGFLILKLNERFEEGLAPFDDVKDQIHDLLARPQMNPKLQEFLNRLRQQAFLEIKDGYIDTQAAPGKDTRWHEVAQIKAQTVTKEEVMSRGRRKRFLGLIPHGKPVRPRLPEDTQTLGEPKDKDTTPPAATPDKSGTGKDKQPGTPGA